MKVLTRCLTAATILVLGAQPASAQTDGIVERISEAFERAMTRVEGAFNLGEGEHAVAWSQSAEGFTWSGSLGEGQSLEIKGVNGPIVAERATGSEVVVTAQARGRRSDPETVRIEMVEHERGLTFCAVYPSRDSDHENYCGPGSAGRMNTSRNDVEVRFRVQVPRGVHFIGRTVNGSVEALELDSDVTLVTVNGDIDVSTSGYAEAETVNGSIEAAMGSTAPGDGLSFSTVNGSISIDVPDDLDADLDASWLNGGLESELPILLDGRMNRRSAQGRLGDGGPPLELATVNGSIRIR